MDDNQGNVAEFTLNPRTKQVERLKLGESSVRFKCQRCATFCCKLGGPKLSEEDRRRLQQIKSNPAEFLDLHGRLKKKADGSCVFLRLDAESMIYQCVIYDFRPIQCRLYPFHVEKAGLNKYTVNLIPCCRGLNTEDGELVNEDFIVNELLDALIKLRYV